MKMIDMTCPKCSAILKADDKREKAVCEYCGYQVLFEKKETADEIMAKAHARSYGYHKGKLDAQAKAQEQAEKRQKTRRIKSKLIVAGVVILLLFMSILYTYLSTPKVNPFDYVEITFQGTDGDGEAVLNVKPDIGDVDIKKIHFTFSKDYNLLQGETITVTAASDTYRLAETSRTYTVESLDEYLKDLDNISEDALELIHLQAESALQLNLDSSRESGFFLDMKPVKLYLLTDGKQTSYLYDVFEARFSTVDGVKTFYVMAGFSEVIIRDGEQTSIKMSSGMYYGNLTQVQGWLHIMAYNSLEEVRAGLLTGQEKQMELKELDLQ